MFNDLDTAESSVKLDDSPAEVACLVNHCYGGEDFQMSLEYLVDCSRIADKYDIPRLQQSAKAYAKQLELNPGNVPRYIMIAHGHSGLMEFKQHCIDYMAKRLQHILNNVRCCGQHCIDGHSTIPRP
jgi:hypothetical protein